MRVRFSTWCALSGALVLSVGCSQDGDEKPLEDAGTRSDRPGASRSDTDGGGRSVDASAPLDASVPIAKPGADASTPVTTITAVTAVAGCSGELPLPPAPSCPLPDLYEPNDGDLSTLLKVDPTCNIAAANLIGSDVDNYRFEASSSDPVLVELVYPKRGDTALSFRIHELVGGNSMTITNGNDGPVQSSAAVSAYFEATAGKTYGVSVQGKLGELCQPYTLRVNPRYCTDEFEDNETAEDAAKLDLGSTGAREIKATVHGADEDFYRFSTPKADPFLITGSYTVDEGSAIAIGIAIKNTAGLAISSTGRNRTGPTEAWSKWVRSETAGSIYYLNVDLGPSAEGCASYTLKVDTAACTDGFEDNDTLSTPAMLPIGSDQQATTFVGDVDHYNISSLASGGTCVVTYATVAGGRGRVSTQLYDGAGLAIRNGDAATVGSNQVITLTWADGSAKTLRVSGDDEVCQPYTVRCTGSAPQPQ